MTTSDLWIKNLSGGESLYQHGGLFGPASDVAWVLLDFIKTGRVIADRATVTDIDATMSGDLLLELLRETEKQTAKPLLERDGHSSIERVNREHRYRVEFIEF